MSAFLHFFETTSSFLTSTFYALLDTPAAAANADVTETFDGQGAGA